MCWALGFVGADTTETLAAYIARELSFPSYLAFLPTVSTSPHLHKWSEQL